MCILFSSAAIRLHPHPRRVHQSKAITHTLIFSASFDAAQACRAGMLSREQLEEIVARQAAALADAAYEDLNLRGEHINLSYRPGGSFKTDAAGRIELRHCNFEFVRRLGNDRFAQRFPERT
jgi:hypothetical protein